MNKPIVLRATHIKKSFSAPAPIEILCGIDLELRAGESLAIVGKSGEGKSTLLHILGTLEPMTSGKLEICGKQSDATSLSSLRSQSIGFIFQTFNLLEDYSLIDNILMPAKIARRPTQPGSAAYRRALELIDAVGLKERTHFLAKLLSGGEKQRAAIARALCNDPQILLADEPSGNLDTAHSQAIHALLLELTRRWDKSLIVVTHDKELSSLCDRTLHLKEGRFLS